MEVTIGVIMSPRVVRVGMDIKLSQVKQILDETGFHHLIVEEDNRLVGILSDRDVLKHISPYSTGKNKTSRDQALLNKRVHQIMSRQPATVNEDTLVHDAAEVMLWAGISCLPVTGEDERVVGMITWRDLLRHFTAVAALSARKDPDNDRQRNTRQIMRQHCLDAAKIRYRPNSNA